MPTAAVDVATLGPVPFPTPAPDLPLAPGPAPSAAAGIAPAVQAALATYLDARIADADAIDAEFGAAAHALASFVLSGGKRIRPTFAWWGWRGSGRAADDADAPAVVRAISALELVQASALIHDDLIDASATRRGRPTVHVEFARSHDAAGWRGQPARFGAAAAILLGDLALSWADDLLHEAGLSTAALRRALPAWRAMRTEVLGGQFLDVRHQAAREVTVRAALQIDRYKTAAYTVERPLHLGAALADAPHLLNAYRRFGADIGVAFQLRDDLLGVYGDPEVTGKPAGDDLREGKTTLLVALAVERATHQGHTAARDEILAALGDPDLDPDRLARVRDILIEMGAVQAVEQRIAGLTGSALDALTAAEVAEPAASELAGLAVTATRRRS